MNFFPFNFATPKFGQYQTPPTQLENITNTLSSFKLPGFNHQVSDDGSLLTLEWKGEEEYSPDAIHQLSTLQDLPPSIRFCVKRDIYNESIENTDHFFSHFGTNVEELIVTGGIWDAPVNDVVVQKVLASCPNVNKVDCSWGDGITGEFIAHLPPSVRELKIRTCRTLQEKNLSALKGCKGLEIFSLQNYISREDGFFGLSTPDFKGTFIKDLPSSLRSLTLIQYEFDETNLVHLGNLSKLEHLAFELCINLEGTFIEHLNPELESFDLNGCKAITSENIGKLKGFQQLRELCCPTVLRPAVEQIAPKLPNCRFIESRF